MFQEVTYSINGERKALCIIKRKYLKEVVCKSFPYLLLLFVCDFNLFLCYLRKWKKIRIM